MSPYFDIIVKLLVIFTIIMIGIGFMYIWFYIAKKEKLIKHIHPEEKRRNQKKMQDIIWGPLIKASEYIGPTAKKYPLMFDFQKDELTLVQAGNPHGLRMESLHGLRFVLGMGSLFIAILYSFLGMPFALLLLVILPVSGFMFPSLWIMYQAKERQEIISTSMPDFLDTVSITLQAGVSMDAALRQVTNQMDGPLSEEIQRFNREIDLGVQRRQAFQSLLDRNTSKELEMLVNSLVQGADLGVPVSTTFRVQAEDLRAMRGFKAKEKAAKASPQVTLVTTFLVAPAVFLLIIGLLFLNMLYNPGAFGLDVWF
ncbi:type II secretion system F family protein [Lederbergia lenta]|uniref:Flp pilus assembly protein TadB n=1 Tax=Lederbergia lenta TaxID=1467 RepID=A0A2X4VZZ2_LEDLE|nr:type II secretion system F family protein [Lederbergia lenta]MCM3113221.1 type II secretion system F family protein [Lederbergia lenta]MEC2325990.1 type II secretion system F family protein [Lederbergia lenta]SQI53398.1 Flp pilus assembly protein TadB [Lederbergia lenta]